MICVNMTKLLDVGMLTMGYASRVKHWCTKVARETISLARECMGANGILLQNRVMKSFIDMEAVYTYEGTSDINALISDESLLEEFRHLSELIVNYPLVLLFQS